MMIAPMSTTHARKRLSRGNDTEYTAWLQYKPVIESRESRAIQLLCQMARIVLKVTKSPSNEREVYIMLLMAQLREREREREMRGWGKLRIRRIRGRVGVE